MDTALMTRSEETPAKESIIHWVWDDNPDETYCGQDASNEPWTDPSFLVNCKECVRIAEICDLEEMMEND